MNKTALRETAAAALTDLPALALVHPGSPPSSIDEADLPAAYISTPESGASSEWLDEPGDDVTLQVQLYVQESNQADAALDSLELAVRLALEPPLAVASLQWLATQSGTDEAGSGLASATLTFAPTWRS